MIVYLKFVKTLKVKNPSDGCTDCVTGKWSGSGQKTSCTTQECPAGHKSTLETATSAIDGCTNCGVGKWSGTGSKTSCFDQECPSGK